MNDSIETAELITVPSVVTGTTVGANIASGTYPGETYAQAAAWYRIVITELTYVRMTVSGIDGFRPYIETYYQYDPEIPPDNFDAFQFYWDDWWEAGPDGTPWTQRCPFAPGTYWIAVMDWNFANQRGDFSLDVSFAPIGRNDLEPIDNDNLFGVSDTSRANSFFVNPGEGVYLRVGATPVFASGESVDFAIRKQSTPALNDLIADSYELINPVAICTPSDPPVDANYWTNKTAEAEPDEPAHAGFPARKSVFFNWDPTPGVPYDVWVESDDDDFVLAIYDFTGTIEDLGTALAADDDSGVGNQPFLTFTPTSRVLIVVDSKGTGGDFKLWARLSSATRPPNDDFDSPTILPGTAGVVAGNLAGSTFECGTPIIQEALFGGGTRPVQPLGGDVWYQFTPTGTDYTLTWTSPNPVRVSVYTGTELGTLALYTNFSGNGYSNDAATGSETFGVTPGVTYTVRVEQANNAQSTVEFTYATPVPETGDNIENAPVVVVPGTGGTSTYDYALGGAGQQPSEPVDTTGQTIRSVWRKFVPDHDCVITLQYLSQSNVEMNKPSDHNVDVWRGPTPTLGALDLVPLQYGFWFQPPATEGAQISRVSGYATRLKKNETYWIRYSNPSSSPPGTAQRVKMYVDYEMEQPWTDDDGFDSETGTSTMIDGVLSFSEQATRTVQPWLGDHCAYNWWLSFDMRLEVDWSPTADGPVLGRQPGPSVYYPWMGNRIGVLKLHFKHGEAYGTTTREMNIVGNRDGDSWLELTNGLDSGTEVSSSLWSPFGLPNSETEHGEWIRVDITPIGVYIQGRLCSGVVSPPYLTAIEFGTHKFPVYSYWGTDGPFPADQVYGPPETFTLQLRNMRFTDSLRSGPRIFERVEEATPVRYQNMITEFDTRIGSLASSNRSGYQDPPRFMTGEPNALQVPNPTTREWDAIRIHNQCRYWQVNHKDNPRRHSGCWFYFDQFPTDTNGVVAISSQRGWSGFSYGYMDDVCRLEVNALGELWVYPHRNWWIADQSPTFNRGRIHRNSPKFLVGKLVIGEWYWIETLVDFTFPWDTVVRVAVNEVECAAEYRGILNQSLGNVAEARYNGTASPFINYVEQAFGTPAGTPNPSDRTENYTGHCDLYVGPWFMGRGGLESYASREGLPDDLDLTQVMAFPGIGAHAGAMVAFTRDGVHKILDRDDPSVDFFETAAAAGTVGGDFFEYKGVRLYKGSQSVDKSLNYDMSLGTSGYSAYGWASQPALPPVTVADGTGPSAPFPDHSGELALQWEHDPSGPGDQDNARFGENWNYVYVGVDPPDGVREGGDPNDDGGNHFVVFAFVRRVGGTYAQIDMMYGLRGDIAAGPEYGLVDEDWHWLWGNSYPNYDYSQGSDGFGHWRFYMEGGAKIRMKDIHVFMNAMVYPRFKTTLDDGATTVWIEHPDDPVVSFLGSDPTQPTSLGVFVDNTCPFGRLDRTGPQFPWLLGPITSGLSIGDYRNRRYVEIRPPDEPELEDTNLKISSLRVMVRAAGYGANDTWGDISTARTSGTLKVRMVHGTHTHVVQNFPVPNTDKVLISQVIPMTPMGFAWQTDRVSETKIRLLQHFNYTDKSLDDSYGYRMWQAGAAVCKSIAYEAFCETEPGPPICGGATKWQSRLTRRI